MWRIPHQGHPAVCLYSVRSGSTGFIMKLKVSFLLRKVMLLAVFFTLAEGARAQELRLVPLGSAYGCMDYSIELRLVGAGKPVFGYQVSLSYPADSFEPVSFEGELEGWSSRRSGRFPFAPASPCEQWADGNGVDRILVSASVYPDPGVVGRTVADEAAGGDVLLGRIVFRPRDGAAGGTFSATEGGCPGLLGSLVEYPTAFFDADGRTLELESQPLVAPILSAEVEDLACRPVDGARAELSWSPPGAAASVETVQVSRDGTPPVFLPVDSGSYLDEPGPGLHRYEITSLFADGRESCISSCEVEIVIEGEEVLFIRGDSDSNDRVNLSDAIQILRYLYQAAGIECRDAADVNDSGRIELADAIYLLNFVFQSGAGIPLPYPAAGADPTPDGLGCRPSA